MPALADPDSFYAFMKHAPKTGQLDRAELLAWLEAGGFDLSGAPSSAAGEPHALVVWAEDPEMAFRLYAIPDSELDLDLASLHRRSFSARVHRELEPALFEPAVRLLLRVSFEPQVYFRMLGDIRAGVTQKRSSLPADSVLEPEVARWHRHALVTGADLDKNITELCAVRFTQWSC